MHIRIFAFILLAAILVPGAVIAHAEPDHASLRHWETASADPDRIFLSFCGDPATSRAVTWRTDANVHQAFAEIGLALGEPSFYDAAHRITASTENLDLNLSTDNTQGVVNYHSVVFEGLEPDRLYAYRVGDGGGRWSEWIQFRTAAKVAEHLRALGYVE